MKRKSKKQKKEKVVEPQLEPQTQTEPKPEPETRGRKPKEITLEDIQNQVKEVVINLREFSRAVQLSGKSNMRFHSAVVMLERILRSHLIK